MSTSVITNPTPQHTLTFPFVEAATQTFVRAELMREAISLALASQQNVMFTGPGGHAKSEFIEAVFAAIKQQKPYIKSFGQGTTAEELFGGIDMDALNRTEDATVQFNTDNSFLEHVLAIFGELFDAPARMLTFLKDTLTAKELRNGAQCVQMKTKVIAAATNHSPQKVAELGPAVAALVERFPIQLEVKWGSYSGDDFLSLFETADVVSKKAIASANVDVTWTDIEELQERTSNVKASKTILRILAEILSDLRRDKVTISPRTAMMALQLTRAAATINEREHATPEDINAIKFLPGCMEHADRIRELVSEYTERFHVTDVLDRCETQIGFLERVDLHQANDTGSLYDMLAEADEIHNELNYLQVDFSFGTRRIQLRSRAEALAEAFTNRITILETLQASSKGSLANLGNGPKTDGDVLTVAEDSIRSYRNKLAKTNDLASLQAELDVIQQARTKVNNMKVSPFKQNKHDEIMRAYATLVDSYRMEISKARTRQSGWKGNS